MKVGGSRKDRSEHVADFLGYASRPILVGYWRGGGQSTQR
jgi:hypothetical protein